MLVAEIGDLGQSRLSEASFALAGEGLAREIACAYAERAGVGRIGPGSIDESEWAPAFVENAAARSVVAGSRAVLSAMRSVLLPVKVLRP